jgi:pimeloyl-ACP methyl ester carboxylesterase
VPYRQTWPGPMPGSNEAHWLALHGVPAGARAWDRLDFPMQIHSFRGLGTSEEREDWSLGAFVDEIAPLLGPDTVLLGHDFGGLVAAICALRFPLRGVVLTGTALGPWWSIARLGALPGPHFLFYELFGGRFFMRMGSTEGDLLQSFTSELADPSIAGWMRKLGCEMRPPPQLAQSLSRRCPVHLIWGRSDRCYPPFVARAVARGTGGSVQWVDGGHYCMWENPRAFTAALRSVDDMLMLARAPR